MSTEPDRNQRKALGKGLSALLPQKQTATATAVEAEEFQNIPLEHIRPSEQQPRTSFDGQGLEELAQSIREHGLIQPITVSKLGGGKYKLVAGERRWRAARMAGLKEIPALVRSIRDDQLLELALIENIQREDLNPIEIAMAFYRLATEHGLSHEQIAERTGKDRSTITNFLRLLRLAPIVQDDLIRGSISVGHARALLNISDPEEQRRACERVIDRQLSVRETEKLVKTLTESQIKENKGLAKPVDPNIRAALEELSAALGTRVRLVAKSPTAGRLEIEYYSQDDLDRIYSVIVPK